MSNVKSYYFEEINSVNDLDECEQDEYQAWSEQVDKINQQIEEQQDGHDEVCGQ